MWRLARRRVVGNDPWMVPSARSILFGVPIQNGWPMPAVCKSMYHAIFVSNVETGETKQITDGLADAVWPAWDASGKYLWFLASTDFGLRSQWLDMTSYDHDENFGLYLRRFKERPSPARCFPRATKIEAWALVAALQRQAPAQAMRRQRRRRAQGNKVHSGSAWTARAGNSANRFRWIATANHFGSRCSRASVLGVARGNRRHQCSYLEAGANQQGGGPGGGGGGNWHVIAYAIARTMSFATGVAGYEVSADGRKLLYRTADAAGWPASSRCTSSGSISILS